MYNLSKIGNSDIKIGACISYTTKSPYHVYYGVVKRKINKDYLFCELRKTNRYKIKWLEPKRDEYYIVEHINNIYVKHNIKYSEPITETFHVSRCKIHNININRLI